MEKAKIAVERRSETGKNVARSMRRKGKVPAILYGKGAKPIPITMDYGEFTAILHGQESRNMLLNMHITGDNEQELLALPKDIQFDPLNGQIIHVDFQQVHMDETIHTTIPIHLVGTSPGVKQGGVMEHLMRELEIECLPMEIPPFIENDISQMEIGDSFHVRDLKVGENIRILSDPERTIALVAAPTVDRSAEEEAAEEAVKEAAEAEIAESTEKTE